MAPAGKVAAGKRVSFQEVSEARAVKEHSEVDPDGGSGSDSNSDGESASVSVAGTVESTVESGSDSDSACTSRSGKGSSITGSITGTVESTVDSDSDSLIEARRSRLRKFGVPLLVSVLVASACAAAAKANFGAPAGVPAECPCPKSSPSGRQLLTCNASASSSWVDPVHSMQLSAQDKEFCKASNAQQFWWQYPEERNWCWVGLKAKCHADPQAHRSWAEVQDLAAAEGLAPPRQQTDFSPLKAPELCDRAELGKARNWTAAQRASAKAWFESHVAVYVISLPGQDERWQFVSQRLSKLGICYKRVSGVDLRVPGQLQAAKDAGWMPKGFNATLAQERAASEKQQMGKVLGTLGWASAHFKVQAEIIKDDSPLAVVLEDDVEPADDFVEKLWSLVMEELPCDWEAVSLLSRCPYGRCVAPHLTRVRPDINEPAWRCRQGVNWGTEGLLYRGASLKTLRKQWQQVVFDEERPHCLNIDAALASISDKVAYYAVPAVQSPGFLQEADFGSVRFSINTGTGTGEMTGHELIV